MIEDGIVAEPGPVQGVLVSAKNFGTVYDQVKVRTCLRSKSAVP